MRSCYYQSLPVALVLAIALCGLLGLTPAAHAAGMYLSVRDGMLGKQVCATPLEGLRQLGIDALEVNLERDFSVRAIDTGEKVFLRTDDDAKAFRQTANKLGIRICALLTACDLSANTPEANIAWIARSIQLADLLGAPAVRIDSGMKKEKELSFDKRVDLFVEALSAALKATSGSKVQLGIENHGFQGNNLAFLLNVYQQVNSKRLGSTLDTGNFYWRGYPLSEVYGILRVLAPYAKHTHVKNINYPQDKQEITREAGWEYTKYFCPLDEGNIEIAKVVQILAKAGYKGDICIEDESIGVCKTPEECMAVLKRDADCIRKAIAANK